jgi:hypothetical protein
MTMSYGAKVMVIGVSVKAVLMSAVVTVLAATSFQQSLILVIVSATATGVFALLAVIIQTHSAQGMYERLERLERRAGEAKVIAQETHAITADTQVVAAGIAEAVANNGPTEPQPEH